MYKFNLILSVHMLALSYIRSLPFTITANAHWFVPLSIESQTLANYCMLQLLLYVHTGLDPQKHLIQRSW